MDTMDALYGANPSDVGTLLHIRNVFGHRGVKKKISDCINHVVDFLNFCTEGYVCLLVMQLARIENLSQGSYKLEKALNFEFCLEKP